MRPGARRIETSGSFWWIDEEAGEYLRTPKQEAPRAPGPSGEDWGGPSAGELQDLVWLPMFGWEIRHDQPVGAARLVIYTTEDRDWIVTAAPIMDPTDA